ncbi:Ig-like domain-containing protein [Herbiconiux sp. L3-i23]|uniref:Ig-like domain-containing protein n=1 Tax=Herbiconiux sp. L3-i23 TaxID=2905871 RepID=UPI002074A8DD|nr:Ig-like domain-containing protein [Herbiconiux sp. L3-i23]
MTAWLRERKTLASTLTLAILAGVPVTFAVLHQGFPVTDADLVSRDVWVTNGERLLAGRLNRQIEELNGAVETSSRSIDVFQEGGDVFLTDADASTVERVDPAFTTLVQKADLPPGAVVAFGGKTLAVLDPADGRAWAVDVTNELAFDPVATEPDVEAGAEASITVTDKGALFVASPENDTLISLESPGAAPVVTPLDLDGAVQATTVGDEPVLFDANSNEVIRRDGGRVTLPEQGLAIQQSGPENDSVLVAGESSLLRVPLGGGDVVSLDAQVGAPATSEGQVAPPVWLDGCAHAAWADSGRYLRACGDDPADVFEIDQPTVGSRLVFRVNGPVIALNNIDNGNTWVLKDSLRLVDNWDEVTPPKEEDNQEGDEKSTRKSYEDILADRSEQNRPPTAEDDDFGVRPGRTTILPVLDNDTDPDGDVLTITDFTQLPPEIGRIDEIDDGRALQFTAGTATVGTASFRYTVSDGRSGGVDEALVNVRVVPFEVNNPPVQKRIPTQTLEAGQTLTYNALTDWIDPDGDDIFLNDAAPTSADLARSTPDGFVTFEHRSGELGLKEVRLIVSDGVLTAEGVLNVDVQAPGTLKPIATADYLRLFIDEVGELKPLDNDLSPSGAQLLLAGVESTDPALTVTPNIDAGTVSVQASAAGEYEFTYSVTAGGQASTGIVRVSVIENPADQLPPIAVKDTAFLRVGEPVTVEVLANDVSPSGRVLAIQSVDTSAAAQGLSVEILGNTLIRISSSTALDAQTQFTYTVSDGQATALAGVTVVPVPPVVQRQPPVAVDDRVTVRAGDVARIDVLANDYHPDQSALILDTELVDAENIGDDALAFVSGGDLRYQAPSEPGQYSAVYRVGDRFGESATATVTFVVTGPDQEGNKPPVPVTQTGRTFAGSTIRIDVPLDGIDPDGDSVVLTGLAQAPLLGRIVETGTTYFVYEAFESSAGTDTLRYSVEDAFGLRAFGTVRIGVIPRPAQALAPNAVDDSVEVRPGKLVSVPVLDNDTDPNGYTLELSEELVSVDPGIEAWVEGDRVLVQAPETEGGFVARYEITNGNGGVDQGFVQIRVTADAKILPPTAVDHFVQQEQVDSGEPIEVDVFDGAFNPNGRDDDLVVSFEGPNAGNASIAADGTVTVVPGEKRIAIAYRLTDEVNDLSAAAFIIVPPEVSASYAPPPYIRPDAIPQQLEMNQAGQWKLEDIVAVPSGRPVKITDATTVTASNSDGASSYVDPTTIAFTPARDFRGNAAVVFEVTDGESADDPNGNTVLLTLPIAVGNPDFSDTAPSFTPIEIPVEAGEAAISVDLRTSTAHRNAGVIGQIQYSGLTGATRDIEANLNGSTLTVSSPIGVQPGATATLSFTLSYREFQVPGTVSVVVVSSSRPLPQAIDDEEKGQRSKQSTVNVIENDFNPFPDRPLTLLDARIENAAESAARVSFTANGNITVSPGSSFIGVVSVIYRIGDATKDPNRETQGRLLLTVRDVPSKVAKPTIIEESDGVVAISWQTPAINGEPIDHYTVTYDNKSVQVSANAASYRATGLNNGTPYTFRVSAHNVLGDGQASDQSNAGVPYGKPGRPGTPTLTASSDGSGDMTIVWGAANGNGRDVQKYRWSLSNGATGETTGTSAATKVNVGDAVTATVIAVGPAGDGPASAASASAKNAPGAATGLNARTGAQGDRTVTLTWNGAPSHGNGVEEYRLSISGYGDATTGGTSFSFQGEFNRNYNFTVVAVTKGTAGPRSATSNTVAPQDVPPPQPPQAGGTVAKGGAAPYCNGCRYVVLVYQNFPAGTYDVTTEANGGFPVSTQRYTLSGSGRQETLNGLGYGYSNVRVRATNVATGQVIWTEAVNWDAL